MPADKKKGKGDKKKKSPDDAPSVNTLILKKFLHLYEVYSAHLNSKCCPDVVTAARSCLEEDTVLTKIFVRSIPKDMRAEDRFKKAIDQAQIENNWNMIKELQENYFNPPNTYVSALMKALNEVQFSNINELYIFDIPIFHKDMNELVYFISIVGNPLKHIEILDCMISFETIGKFSSCLNFKMYLTELVLDYNEFGDEGCKELCKGLVGNRSLLSLSLCYCDLKVASGAYLSQILATTALRELYLDGNFLRCQGAMDLIRDIAFFAEAADVQREIELQKKLEDEKRIAAEEAAKSPYESYVPTPVDEGDGKKKKKKKKKGKKKKTKEPPAIGPFAYKIHLADNEIDIYEDGARKLESFNIMHQTIELFLKLVKFSEEIQEIDLHNNAIGNLSAKMILNALEIRKTTKKNWGGVAVRVTEKIDKDLFAAIQKASKKMKKKKKKKKKKS